MFARKHIYDAFMDQPDGAIELFHGYTYSGHPISSAAGIATLDTYRDEGLFQRAADLSQYWEDAAHSLKDANNVIDIRNIGLVAGIEVAPRPGAPGKRAFEAFTKAFEKGVLIRVTGDIIALSPPLIVEKPQIDQIFDTVRTVLKEAA